MNNIAKAELHCHIEGAASVELAQRQAARYGFDISHIIDGKDYRWHDFSSFLMAYDVVSNLFKSDEDYALLAETYLTAIAKGGAIYSEIFVSPDHAISAGLTPQAYFDGLAAGITEAENKTGIITRMIIVGIRHFGPDKVKQAAQLAAKDAHPLITGFGMAGDERYGKVADYSEAFNIAREAGLGITIHAGELSNATSVCDAIKYVQPTRIGHGVRAIEDDRLIEEIVDRNITLEVCPGSNIALNIFENMEQHPLKKLKEAGVLVSLNSDDPPFFKTSLDHEYNRVAQTFGFNDDEMMQFTKNAINAAFVDNDVKQKLLAQLNR